MQQPLAVSIALAAVVLAIDLATLHSGGRVDPFYVLLLALFWRRLDRAQLVTLTFVVTAFVLLPLLSAQADHSAEEWLCRSVVAAILVGLLRFSGATRRPAPLEQPPPRPSPVVTLPTLTPCPFPTTPPPAPRRPARPAELPQAGREKRQYPRFAVTSTVWVAPYSGGKRLNRARFREFGCRDLSKNGLAFLAEEVLTWNVVVICLPGAGEGIYRVAEIMRRRWEGKTCLYGCQFTDRVCPEISDDRELSAV